MCYASYIVWKKQNSCTYRHCWMPSRLLKYSRFDLFTFPYLCHCLNILSCRIWKIFEVYKPHMQPPWHSIYNPTMNNKFDENCFRGSTMRGHTFLVLQTTVFSLIWKQHTTNWYMCEYFIFIIYLFIKEKGVKDRCGNSTETDIFGSISSYFFYFENNTTNSYISIL